MQGGRCDSGEKQDLLHRSERMEMRGGNEPIRMANWAGTCSSPAVGTERRSVGDGLSGLGTCKDGPENLDPSRSRSGRKASLGELQEVNSPIPL